MAAKTKTVRRREAIIEALLVCTDVKQAAERVGIGERSIYRLLNDKEFNREYSQAKQQVFSHAMGVLQNASSEAAQTLIEIMRDKNQSVGVRVRACELVLKSARDGIEIDELKREFDELKTFMEQQNDKNNAAENPRIEKFVELENGRKVPYVPNEIST